MRCPLTFKPPKLSIGCEDLKEDKVYVPDFGSVNQLYNEFGISNDIDLSLNKPQYKNIVEQRLVTIPAVETPQLDDETLAQSFVSKEFSDCELREIAINEAKNFQKHVIDG